MVQAVWRGVLGARVGPTAALGELLSHLRQSASGGQDASPPLQPRDAWLTAQIGIALMGSYEQQREWHAGYTVLQQLHLHGVHYATFSRPPSPLSSPHPSPCGVALMAAGFCLHTNRLDGAIEVLRGCDWARQLLPSNPEELRVWAEGLRVLAERLLTGGLLEGAWQALEALDACPLPQQNQLAVANLHNRLLQQLLSAGQGGVALLVYQKMQEVGLQCLPSAFTALLAGMQSLGRAEEARELCKAAIARGVYSPLACKDVFQLVLPMGLDRLEIQLLLGHHLEGLGENVRRGELQPLTIGFAAGVCSMAHPAISSSVPFSFFSSPFSLSSSFPLSFQALAIIWSRC